MNTPNPLIPQGTFPDTRGRSHVRIAVFAILAVHVVLLGGLLMLGCRKPTTDQEADNKIPTNYTSFQPPTNLPQDTNVLPPPPTNVIVPPPPPTNNISLVPPGPAEGQKEHVVVKGDSFYTLGKRYGVTAKAIAGANPGVDSSRLKIGQKLNIPAPTGAVPGATTPGASTSPGPSNGGEKTYTVKSGDTLLKIAKANGIRVPALRSANALKTDQIKVGQKLKIPGKAVAPITDTASAPVSPGTTATSPTP